MHRAVRPILALPLLLASVACGQTGPTPNASAVLHVVNRTTSAIAIEIGGSGASGNPYASAVRPCAEESVAAGTRGVPSSGSLVIGLLVDPNRNLDQVLARTSADPYDLPDTFDGMSILWTNGEIKAEDLPRWVVVTASRTTILTSAPATPDACVPLATLEPSPSESPAGS